MSAARLRGCSGVARESAGAPSKQKETLRKDWKTDDGLGLDSVDRPRDTPVEKCAREYPINHGHT